MIAVKKDTLCHRSISFIYFRSILVQPLLPMRLILGSPDFTRRQRNERQDHPVVVVVLCVNTKLSFL